MNMETHKKANTLCSINLNLSMNREIQWIIYRINRRLWYALLYHPCFGDTKISLSLSHKYPHPKQWKILPVSTPYASTLSKKAIEN